MVDHHNLTGYSQVVEELDATGAVVATYHYGHDLISQSRLVVDETTGASEWVDRIFLYDGFSLVGADSRAVGGGEEGGRAPESLAPQAGFLRDASGSHVGAYAPLESPLQFPILASIPLRENKGGHVRALTDLEGNITDTFSYDSFGNLLQPSSLFLPTSYLYRGERYDPDLGQYYLRARFYDANLGRFHTLDEYEGRTREPRSLHKYLYAHANPVTGWDPSGRMTLVEVGIAAWHFYTSNMVSINGAVLLGSFSAGFAQSSNMAYNRVCSKIHSNHISAPVDWIETSFVFALSVALSGVSSPLFEEIISISIPLYSTFASGFTGWTLGVIFGTQWGIGKALRNC